MKTEHHNDTILARFGHAWSDYVSQPEPESDRRFVKKIRLSAQKGMLTAGILGLMSTTIYLLVNIVGFGRSPILFSIENTPDSTIILWDKLVIVVISAVAIVLSKRRIKILWSRLFMSAIGLIATFASMFDNLASRDWTAAHAYPTLFMIAIVGTIPFKPLQALSLSIAVMGLILGSEWLLPQFFGIEGMSIVQSHVVYLIILSLMLSGMSIVIYKGRWDLYQLESILRDHKRTLDRQWRTLTRLEDQRSRFFTNISHEFRTPVAIIVGTIEDALDGVFGGIPSKLRVEQIRSLRNARRLLRLVDQMLSLSRLERGTRIAQPTPGNLDRFLKDLVDYFAGAAHRKSMEMEYVGIDRPAWFAFDHDMIEDIVCNLMSNAIKFSENGTIRLTFSIDHANDQTDATISVRDQGPGIPPEDRERIFERLFRSEETSLSVGGSGIGLAVVKESVDAMGGDVELESMMGVGSTFRVIIPLEAVAEESIETSAPAPKLFDDRRTLEAAEIEDEVDSDTEDDYETAPASAPVIAIVDDNPGIRDLLRRRLGRVYRIIEAENGKEGLNVISKGHPALIISDIMMPEMDGFEMMRHLKADAKTASIPVIVLTADTSEEVQLRGLEEGAINHITKPFNQHHLLKLIANTLATTEQSSRSHLLFPVDEEELVSEEDAFLAKASEVVREYLSDSTFTVERFADLMAVDRRTLQRRLKTISGYTPISLLKEARMTQAYSLLKARAYNVDQVTHRVGYNSPAHFSQEFRKYFGTSPHEVRDLRQ